MRSKPRKRKVRVLTYAKLKKRLDAVFSLWTRLRFKGAVPGLGGVVCVSCGSHWDIKHIQAGHFVSRSYLATRWHPENVAPQCMQCNVFKSGNLAAYAAWGVDRYGMDWPARMVSLSKTSVKYSRADLEAMILDYETRVKSLSQSQI